MKEADLLIIGAGPAGLAAAGQAAAGGARVVVLEASAAFGHKPCGGVISEPFSGFSLRDFSADTSRIVVNIYPDLLFRTGTCTLQMSQDDRLYGVRAPAVFRAIDRTALEERMAERATAAGAQLRMNTPVTAIRRESGAVVVNGSLKARLLIGADGARSVVRRRFSRSPTRMAFAITALTRDRYERPPFPELFFDFGLTHSTGYAWRFPLGNGWSNSGIGGINRKRLGGAWPVFREMAGLRQEGRARGGLIPARLPCRSFFDNVMLAGDAACMTDCLVGAGLHTALVSGLCAGRTALQALGAQRFDAGFLARYERDWRHAFGHKLLVFRMLGAGFYGSLRISGRLSALGMRAAGIKTVTHKNPLNAPERAA